MSAHKIKAVKLDPDGLSGASAEVEHERRVAIYDLVEENDFHPLGSERGPYELMLGLKDNRLNLDVTGPEYRRGHVLSLTPLRGVIKDYEMICDSYLQAVRGSSQAQIEAVDMGRRGLHDEGARLLRERLDGKIAVDHETSRRLFTLVCALCKRG